MAKNNEITLEYDDGKTVTVKPKVRHLVAAEEKFGKGPNGTPPLKGALYASWLALDRPNGSFSSWLNTVDSVVMPEEDEDDADPSAAAQDSDET